MNDSAAVPGGSLANSPATTRFYRDPHETSLSLLLTGSVVTASEAIQLAWPGGFERGPLWDWPTAFLLAGAFGALWMTFDRRATVHGLERPRGFGTAAIIALLASVPPLVLVLFYAGPFAVFGAGLIIAGVRCRNRALAGWGAVAGAVGVFEGFFGITNRLPGSLWAGWEHRAIYLGLGLLTLLAALVARSRELRAVTVRGSR